MLWDRVQQFKHLGSLVFCFGFSIISLVWNGNFTTRAVANSNKLTFSISAGIDSFLGFFKNIGSRLQTSDEIKAERDKLQKLVEEYKILPQNLETLQQENNNLRKELGFKVKANYKSLKSEVLSVRLNSIYRTIIIDKGKNDGILPYMPVVARATNNSGEVISALVGKVIAVDANTSVVQPLINSNFSLGVQVAETSLWLVLGGNSNKGTFLILNYIDGGVIINPRLPGQIGPMQEEPLPDVGILGKTVLTSGAGGLFPPKIPVGYVIEEGPRNGSFKTAYVKPYVSFEQLRYVTVLLKLPDKWIEEWPEEKSLVIDNPFYGELNFPNEKLDKPDPKQNPKDPKSKEKSTTSPLKETTKKSQPLNELEEDYLRGNSP
ncbi:MAG: rod shape-determining protein MreC [Leptospiraceae bacterium]|nr:rod shape-determining protein MreC [Leptospiraceae bacterium]